MSKSICLSRNTFKKNFDFFFFRFESLTLSHNNMIALKPVLSAWLEEAEAAKRDPDRCGNGGWPPGTPLRKMLQLFYHIWNQRVAGLICWESIVYIWRVLQNWAGGGGPGKPKFCLFWPVFGCWAPQTLVNKSLLQCFCMFSQGFEAKMKKNETNRATLRLVAKHWSTQKCWLSTFENWWKHVLR